MYNNPLQPAAMQERYKELPPEITELFEYNTVGVVIDDIARDYNLNEQQKTALLMEIEMVLYLFLPRAGFATRIQESLELDPFVADQIAAYIEEYLFLIVDDILTYAEIQLFDADAGAPTVISATPETAPVITPMTSAPINVTPTKEQNLDQPPVLKPLRTFAMDVDMSRAHGYGAFQSGSGQSDEDEPVHSSNQDDILKK